MIDELLYEQPEPKHSDGLEVGSWLQGYIRAGAHPVSEEVIQLLHGRLKQGEERYGVRLRANDGRWSAGDAAQEAADLVYYTGKEFMEYGRPWAESAMWTAIDLLQTIINGVQSEEDDLQLLIGPDGVSEPTEAPAEEP